MLINESKEAGDQGYYNILKDQAEYIDRDTLGSILDIVNPTDILLFPGRYDTSKIIKSLHNFDGKIHIDFHYDSENILSGVTREIETIILSTSSEFYKAVCCGTLEGLVGKFKDYNIHKFLIKENRGGSFCYLPTEQVQYESASYYVPSMHSVGVGDVYNAVFISNMFGTDIAKRMRLAALCAAKYAETMSYEKYHENAQLVNGNFNEINELIGIRLPWNERKQVKIYIAAPDFPDIDTRILDRLNECLLYHNFSPILPIRENGIATRDLSYMDKHIMYQKDVALLEDCNLLIAVLLYNDPGTFVELGMIKRAGKPTIIYDPFNYCENMFVQHTPDYFCKTVIDVIEAVYLCMGRRLGT
jgi:hypothetical protein